MASKTMSSAPRSPIHVSKDERMMSSDLLTASASPSSSAISDNRANRHTWGREADNFLKKAPPHLGVGGFLLNDGDWALVKELKGLERIVFLLIERAVFVSKGGGEVRVDFWVRTFVGGKNNRTETQEKRESLDAKKKHQLVRNS